MKQDSNPDPILNPTFFCYITKAIMSIIHSFDFQFSNEKIIQTCAYAILKPRCSMTSETAESPPRSWKSYNLSFFWVTLSWVQGRVDNHLCLFKNGSKSLSQLRLMPLTISSTFHSTGRGRIRNANLV